MYSSVHSARPCNFFWYTFCICSHALVNIGRVSYGIKGTLFCSKTDNFFDPRLPVAFLESQSHAQGSQRQDRADHTG